MPPLLGLPSATCCPHLDLLFFLALISTYHVICSCICLFTVCFPFLPTTPEYPLGRPLSCSTLCHCNHVVPGLCLALNFFFFERTELWHFTDNRSPMRYTEDRGRVWPNHGLPLWLYPVLSISPISRSTSHANSVLPCLGLQLLYV
jgi:hypothetical protein